MIKWNDKYTITQTEHDRFRLSKLDWSQSRILEINVFDMHLLVIFGKYYHHNNLYQIHIHIQLNHHYQYHHIKN